MRDASGLVRDYESTELYKDIAKCVRNISPGSAQFSRYVRTFVDVAMVEKESGLVSEASGLVRDASGLVREASGLVRSNRDMKKLLRNIKDISQRTEDLEKEAGYVIEAEEAC